jgi:predicted signal transduction protein with EAL and GGDEF domain
VREVARRLVATLPSTTLVATAGDGELAVLLADLDGDPHRDAETAAGQAARRRLAADADRRRRVRSRARIGVSVLPGDAADEHALLRHAEVCDARGQADRRGPAVSFYDGGTSTRCRSC